MLQASKLQPNYFDAYNDLGACYNRAGQYTQAAEQFELAGRASSLYSWRPTPTSPFPSSLFLSDPLSPCLPLCAHSTASARWAVASKPEHINGLSNAGLNQLAMRDWEKAFNTFDQARMREKRCC